MDEMLNKTIRWECTNWFFREDGFIQVYTQSGSKVILNSVLTNIWAAIDYEITISELWGKVESDVSKNDFTNVLKELNSYNLISLIDKTDEFDSIFN